MHIGIIVHSFTGNTLSIAKKLEETFINSGHSVSIEKVTAVNEDPSVTTNIKLESLPKTEKYDSLIFAAPVRGFSLSPVMSLYLSSLTSLKGKKVSLFVTQHLPYAFLGGNRAIKQMTQICKTKGAVINKTGVINFKNKQKEQQIIDLLNDFQNL